MTGKKSGIEKVENADDQWEFWQNGGVQSERGLTDQAVGLYQFSWESQDQGWMKAVSLIRSTE